ncbi:MAG: MFS transporter [Kofleriaceae bacterium]
MSEGSLWRHADFLRLWAAQAISAFGSRITRTALPIIAVETLGVRESLIAALVALQLAPGVVLALFAGGFIDRPNKRKILIGADLVRAAAVASLTLAWVFDALSMAHVIAVGAIVGAASAMFQITDNAYLPALIGKRHLAEGNAKLEATDAIAEIGGPASTGALITALGAPLTVVFDAASYVWSAIMLGRIKAVEQPLPSTRPRRVRGGDLRIGFNAVLSHPLLRPILLSHMMWSISGGFFISLYTPYCLRELQLSESTFGVIVAMGGVGSLAGALVSRRFVGALGVGKTLVITATLSLACALFIPLAGTSIAGSFAMVVGFLIAHQLLSDGFSVAFVILAVTLRQTVIPKDMLGRVNAAIHVCTSGLLVVAALAAGWIADHAGTPTAVWVGVLVGLVPPFLLLPLWNLREMPAASRDSASVIDAS